MAIEWSRAALVDLDRFAAFLHKRDPALAAEIAAALQQSVDVLEAYPLLGWPVAGREDTRRLVLQVRKAPYVIHYHIVSGRIIILRVRHGRARL